MKTLSLLLLSLALTSCGKDEDKNTSSSAVTTNPEMDLHVHVDPAAPGATFARFYGNYKVTGCETLADKATDIDYCSYTLVAIHGNHERPGMTLVALRKHIENGLSEGAQMFDKASSFPRGTYFEEGDRLASVKRDFPAPNTIYLNETTMRKLDDGTFTLTLRDVFKTPDGKNNRDQEFRLALARD